MLLKKVLSEYFEEDYGGVLKVKQVFLLGLLIYEESSLTFDNNVINRFIIDNKNKKIGFHVDDKSKESGNNENADNNQEG